MYYATGIPGYGRGRCARYYPPQATELRADEELRMLEEEEEMLKEELEDLNKALEDLREKKEQEVNK